MGSDPDFPGGLTPISPISPRGSGFIRIRDALRDYPEIRLELEEISGGFSVTFVRETSQSGGVTEGVTALLNLITK